MREGILVRLGWIDSLPARIVPETLVTATLALRHNVERIGEDGFSTATSTTAGATLAGDTGSRRLPATRNIAAKLGRLHSARSSRKLEEMARREGKIILHRML
jgi:hypothetical protein